MINDKIVSLNLFSYLSLAPQIIDNKDGVNVVDINIQVREKNYGVISVSPGFRSDIGFKVDMNLQKGNIKGENKNLSLNTRVNSRTDFTQFDSSRENFNQDFLEYRVNLNYIVPYLFQKEFKLTSSSEFARRRFYGFDADILRASAQASKQLTSKSS